MAKLVLVEDDAVLRRELKLLLETYGYTCAAPINFTDMPEAILRENPDLVLLDLTLPGKDGYSICRELRLVSRVPVIVLTSRDTEADELLSMSFGADDFIAKPFNRQILLAQTAAVLKRSGLHAGTVTHRGVTYDPGRGTVSFEGREAELTKNESRILSLLFRSAGQIVSREELMNELWQSDEFIDDNTLTVNMNRLRRTLEGIGVRDFLTTRRGKGYEI